MFITIPSYPVANYSHYSPAKFFLVAPAPKPLVNDEAYFSNVPKLIIVKQSGKIDLSLITREVSGVACA